MRPAHSAREIGHEACCSKNRFERFNEARAFSAGNLAVQRDSRRVVQASMRPAHSAREISVTTAIPTIT